MKLLLCLALILSGGLFGCATKPDAIGLLVDNLSAEPMWDEGIMQLTVTAVAPEEVVAEAFRRAELERGRVTHYQILKIRKVHIDLFPDAYTAALVDTNLGRMIVLMQYIKRKDSIPSITGRWWYRIYSALPANQEVDYK